jgi:uncharacterized membrane protein
MFKLSAVIGSMAFLTSSWFSGTTLPRLTHGTSDYLLMPLLGYITIIIAAQIATRVIKEPG